MNFASFNSIPLREKDLSPRAIYVFRLSSILFLVCGCSLVISDMLAIDLSHLFTVTLQLLLFAAVVMINLNRLSWRIGFPVNNLDEWELKLKSDTELVAYRIIVGLTVITLFAAVLTYQFEPEIIVSMRQILMFVILWMIAVFILPLAVMAWRLKPLAEELNAHCTVE